MVKSVDLQLKNLLLCSCEACACLEYDEPFLHSIVVSILASEPRCWVWFGGNSSNLVWARLCFGVCFLVTSSHMYGHNSSWPTRIISRKNSSFSKSSSNQKSSLVIVGKDDCIFSTPFFQRLHDQVKDLEQKLSHCPQSSMASSGRFWFNASPFYLNVNLLLWNLCLSRIWGTFFNSASGSRCPVFE